MFDIQKVADSDLEIMRFSRGSSFLSRLLRLAILGFSVLLFPACDSDEESSEESSSTETPEAPPARVPNFNIIADQSTGSSNRSVDIRLEEKVSESQLRRIASKVRSSSALRFEKTFIIFYLPDQEVGAGGWATANFTPRLSVEILGFSSDDGRPHSRPSSHEVIGRWEYDSLVRYTLVKVGDAHQMESLFSDGSKGSQEVVVSESNKSFFIRPKKKGGNGEYWVRRTQSNYLGLINKQGKVFGMAKPIESK